MKCLLFLLLVGLMYLDTGVASPEDYIDNLLRSYPDLQEVPEWSRTKMGGDRIYIEKDDGRAPIVTMSVQTYAPGQGPVEQSARFPMNSGAAGGGGEKKAPAVSLASEEPEEE